MTPHLVAVLGRGIVPSGEPVLTADDLGFTRGDGCFDATRVVTDGGGASRVDNLDAHLDRFARSAELLDLPRLNRAAWTALVTGAVQAWTQPGEATLKLLMSRGVEHAQSGVTGVVTITPFTQAAQRGGVAVSTLCRGYSSTAFTDARWLLGGVKSLSYAIHTAALREAARRGTDEVLFTTLDGFALEGPTSALVWHADGVLGSTTHTGTGILASITQHLIFQAAQAEGLTTRLGLIRPAELLTGDGAWLVSSIRGIVPVLSLDGAPLAQDDAMTQRLNAWTGF